ncbi:MAG: D-2-hydroxyacid dehydrogenase [Pseudomonadota bacterium]|nr:D-2-hydroxyacid dehydrogenase [Pseudomonadota bacterium]
MKVAVSAYLKSVLGERLPPELEVAWFANAEEADHAVAGAEVVLLDLLNGPARLGAVIESGKSLKWVSSSFAGIDRYPLDLISRRGLLFTHGGGINAVAVAEWAVMSVFVLAKGFHQVVLMHERAEWGTQPYGTAQVAGSKILLIGYGYIGKEIHRQLVGIGADVTLVRSRADPANGVLGPEDWKSRLPEFDHIILSAPGTRDTRHMIGAEELQAMKKTAGLINIARGSLIDQDALVAAVRAGEITGAVLDPTQPEPLPSEHPLWHTPGITVTAHLAGRSTSTHRERAADLFLENLRRYRAGEKMINLVDPARGY